MYTNKPIKKARQEGRAKIYGGSDGTRTRNLPARKAGRSNQTELHAIFKRHESAQELSRALRELISQGKIVQN
jgi:hypothetical protein